MNAIKFHILKPNDTENFRLIADWYFNEWKIPNEKTIQKLQSVTQDQSQFHVLMTLNDKPIGSGGLYHHISLLDKESRFKIYKNWLALVYTIPKERQKGYGALLCRFIQQHAKEIGVDKMHLFTDTAESLYKRLGWAELERLTVNKRNIVVMTKEFN